MNKKIKIIDLFNKIANGEDLPIKIQYGYDRNNCCAIWQLNPSLKDYCCNKRDIGDNQLFADYIGDITVVLNNEVDILEDNTEDIKKIELIKDGLTIENISSIVLADRLNEVINVVNELRKEKE